MCHAIKDLGNVIFHNISNTYFNLISQEKNHGESYTPFEEHPIPYVGRSLHMRQSRSPAAHLGFRYRYGVGSDPVDFGRKRLMTLETPTFLDPIKLKNSLMQADQSDKSLAN